jgi:pimeloyl-ACP methyl ester carboxylesterase
VTRDVVLVPGLWMPGAAMALLAGRLARHGYQPRVFAYPGRATLDANAKRLAAFTREALGGREAHFVGHSLGGVLALEVLNGHREVRVASLLLLGAPVRGCYAGRRFALAGIGRWMLGQSRPIWDERAVAWTRSAPLGVIAGTLPLGLGRLFGRLPEPNDGVVCVSETEVPGTTCRALLPLGHSSLIVSRRVAALTERFLAERRFE